MAQKDPSLNHSEQPVLVKLRHCLREFGPAPVPTVAAAAAAVPRVVPPVPPWGEGTVQLLGLSATVSNVDEIARWMGARAYCTAEVGSRDGTWHIRTARRHHDDVTVVSCTAERSTPLCLLVVVGKDDVSYKDLVSQPLTCNRRTVLHAAVPLGRRRSR